MRYLTILLLGLASTGCAYRDFTPVPMGDASHFAVPLGAADQLVVRVPAGDVDVIGGAGDKVIATLAIECPENKSSCFRRMRDVRFVAERDGNVLTVRLNRNGAFGFRDAQVNATIEVPSAPQLLVDMTAGDLSVEHANACLEIDAGAGDINVVDAADRYGRVFLDAGVGDAHLEVNGRSLPSPRALLIGAEVDWQLGSGDCELLVDLQAGDIDVRLQ